MSYGKRIGCQRKRIDHEFANSSKAQLDFIYVKSPHYEKEHLRYLVSGQKITNW